MARRRSQISSGRVFMRNSRAQLKKNGEQVTRLRGKEEALEADLLASHNQVLRARKRVCVCVCVFVCERDREIESPRKTVSLIF